MLKKVKIITNTPKEVLVEVAIHKRKFAKDKYIFVSIDNIRSHLKNNLNLDLSKYHCDQTVSLCNYTDQPVLSRKVLFTRIERKKPKTVSTVKSSLVAKNTNLTENSESDKVEDKLLGTENLE